MSLLVGIIGLALRASVLGSEPTLLHPVWTAAVFMLSVVGAGLLTIGMAFREVGSPEPVRQD
ncbi:hypothetical protein GCM10011509_29430 [Ornithinimicrobium pekingense]|uniref:Uncharacterized protein n=1 Tax=Ornithinimicrobium pekingense TaxID=384677 RepID=A0ABQ2FE88_9MICO|nr:hypothetical protein GCM10011509_29430 [Ornithinimicrobium pekingense]